MGLFMCADRYMLRRVCTWLAVINALKSLLAYLAHIAGEENSHEFVFPLQLAGHQRERGGGVRTVPLLLEHTGTESSG